MKHGQFIDADLESSPLEIKTDSTLGSNDEVRVMFVTAGREYAGEAAIYFTSTPQYKLHLCTSDRTNFPVELPTDTVKVWRITLTRTSGVRLVIHCNEVEVLNFLLSDLTCNDSSWSTVWSRDVEKMSFSQDTATDFYSGESFGQMVKQS